MRWNGDGGCDELMVSKCGWMGINCFGLEKSKERPRGREMMEEKRVKEDRRL